MSRSGVLTIQRIAHAVYSVTLVLFAAIVVAALVYQIMLTPLMSIVQKWFVKPCEKPILYSLDTFDARFGISKSTFLAHLEKAESLWEQAAGKQLFEYEQEQGTLKINLVYDERQASTVKLQKLGMTLKDDRATYDELKAKYDQISAELAGKKALLDAMQRAYEQDVKALNAQIAKSNGQKRVSRDEYDQLMRRQGEVDAEYAKLVQAQDDLNALVDVLNAVTTVLNQKAKIFNSTATTYNTVGSSTGKSFDEGMYVETSTSTSINIYQFDDQAKLIRVLAHELGHALGLEHVSDTKAIMYYMNEGMNEKLTATDISELKALCETGH